MPTRDTKTVHEHAAAIRDAVADQLAANGCAADDPAHYGLDVINLSSNAARFDLVLTFRSGRAYCCQEPVCHLAPFLRRFWEALRETIEDRGLRQPPPMRLVHVHVAVEPGAVFSTHADFGFPPSSPTFEAHRLPGWAEAEATA